MAVWRSGLGKATKIVAVDLMYSATRNALNDRFAMLTDPDCLLMTLVGPQEEVTIFDNF